MKKVFLKMVKSNHLYFKVPILYIVFFALALSSCSNDDNQPSVKVITEISEDIKNLIYFRGDEKAPKVVINVQSGPDTKLDTMLINLISQSFNAADLLTVNVHQAQTLDSTIVTDNDITLDQAVAFNAQSIIMLDKVVSYFKNQGRTVYLLGDSFGSFVTQDFIAKKGIDRADKYLIMTGRLDIDDIMWQALADGRVGRFEDGVTPIFEEEPVVSVKERNLNLITAALGMKRYTQLLAPVKDLSDITYVYGAKDEAVGSLTAAEVAFLESRNVNVIMGPGGHDDTFWNFVEQGFKEAFGIEP